MLGDMMSSNRPWNHGNYIRARREALGFSQPALARAARVTPAMINRLESGQRRGRPPLLRAVADALQVPPAELLERAGYAAEARYWREREEGLDTPDPIGQLRNAVSLLPCRPAVRAALMTLVTELARDHEQEYAERFDKAVKRYPDVAYVGTQSRSLTPSEQDTAKFTVLRELIFEPPEPSST
jgi:transcriptional regulator with XRE-family HTH domain